MKALEAPLLQLVEAPHPLTGEPVPTLVVTLPLGGRIEDFLVELKTEGYAGRQVLFFKLDKDNVERLAYHALGANGTQLPD